MQSQFQIYVFVIFSQVIAPAQQRETLASQGTLALRKADKMMAQGDRYRAGPLYRQAEALFESEQNANGQAEARLGELRASTDQGDYPTIKSQAERELETSTVQNDPELKIKALALIGLVDLNIDTAAAGYDFSQLLTVATAVHDLKWQNRARGELAIVAGINGKVAEAGVGLLKAIAASQKLGDMEGAFYFTLWLANGMAINGMADGALKQLTRADQFAKESGFGEAPLALTIAHLRAIANSSEEVRSQHLGEAERLYSDALRQAQRESVPGAEIELLTQHGKLALASSKANEAEQSLEKAIDIAQSNKLTDLEVDSAMSLAELLLSTNQPLRAQRILEGSTKAAHAKPDRLELPHYLGVQADTAAALHEPKKADRLYERAKIDLEGLLVNAPSSRVKASMISVYGHIYVGQFRLAAEQLHKPARAFEILESARGRVLLDSLRSSHEAKTAPTASNPELQISRLQRKLLQEHLTETQARAVLARLDSAYDQMAVASSEQNRREVQVLRGSPVSLADFSHTLDSGTVFLAFILDRDASFAFQVNASGETEVYRLPARAEIEKLVLTYLKSIKAKEDSSGIAEKLYSILLKPAFRSNPKSLILAPDGSLHLLPFQTLRDENGKLVLERASISFAPSATVLSAIRKSTAASAPAAFLGLAYSSTDKTDADSNRGLAELRGADLKPLQFGSEEVHQAKDALGNQGDLLEGSQASESELKHQNLSRFQVIHLAAHAFGDQLEPDRAGMVLYPGSPAEDGLWQAREIRATKLQADVVVLSACETGTGRLEGEEGIMNLARAFLTAGAKSVVASQWDVDDRSTATLMESFYRQLASGKTVQESLRQAQLEFVRNYGTKASPYYWAGFSVYGDGGRTIAATSNRAHTKPARTNFR